MKKILFSVCIAALAMGCSKTEVNYEPQQQIAFAPVAKNATKAALAGDAIPTTSIIVSANAGNAGSTLVSQCTQNYFSEVTFTQEGSTGIFSAANCYWPNVQYLSFAGVTASVRVSDANTSIDVAANSITVENYAQPEFTVANNDLMWFPSTTPVGKATPTIAVEMSHACTWIVLNFIGDAVSGGTNPWKITKITIDALSDKETATLTYEGDPAAPKATWTENSTKKPFTVYQGTQEDTYDATVGLPLQNASIITTSENNILVIPQTPCDMSVTYQYLSGTNTITETATASLKFNGNTKWDAGTKYTYTVTIGATPIKIQPDAAGWVTDVQLTPSL